MGRLKKYNCGIGRFHICTSIDRIDKVNEICRNRGITQTEFFEDLIDQAVDNAQDSPEASRIARFKSLQRAYHVNSHIMMFDSILFSNFEIANEWFNRLTTYMEEAKRHGFEDQIQGDLETRVAFLTKVVMSDIFRELRVGDVRKQEKLWYSFNDYVENGFRRPEKPRGWGASERERRKQESEELAKDAGLPCSTIKRKTLQNSTIGRIPVLEHKEEAVYDDVFDKLMDNAHSEDTGRQTPPDSSTTTGACSNSPRNARKLADQGGVA